MNENTIYQYVVNPCYKDGKGCPDRKVGCHGSCEAYQEFWDKRREANKKRVEYLEMNNDFWDLYQKRLSYKAHYKKGRKKK